MSIAYLNGEYLPLEEARISPLDRGFLFGDGIYEVIPYYSAKPVGLTAHIARMQNGLSEIGIASPESANQWAELLNLLVSRNSHLGENLGVYVHVSRGTDSKRYHAYPEGVTPTVFAFCFKIKDPEPLDRSKVTQYSLISSQDLRWQRCHIKSTALLGNVLHFQEGYASGNDEVLLYNADHEITEGSASNLFFVKDGVVITPKQDNQILAGITRRIIIDSLKAEGSLRVEERTLSLAEAQNADEIWLTSSSKEIAPVTQLDGKPVGNGEVGAVWEKAFAIYTAAKFEA